MTMIPSTLEMKSRWNCGSITCIMCFTCVGSQLSINSSNASSFSGPLQLCTNTQIIHLHTLVLKEQ
uniref:Uncharacterized protein n=1 Tax=Pygocentrus nattereri TaxID=42514 RepID=A0A3B4CQ08_PYGNA